MSFHIYHDAEVLAAGLAEWIAASIAFTLREKELFSFVLSGGSTPKALYKKLASDYQDKVDWQRVRFFWGDERAVPFEDERNNARMAYQSLLKPLDIPEDHIHLMRTDLSPGTSAEMYDQLLRDLFKNDQTTFDLTLLGLGEDGHTLSLFPDSSIDINKGNWVDITLNTKENIQRITLLPSVVNKSKNIIFMVQGKNKSAVLKQIIQPALANKKLPANLIEPETGSLLWFIDSAAAANISFGN